MDFNDSPHFMAVVVVMDQPFFVYFFRRFFDNFYEGVVSVRRSFSTYFFKDEGRCVGTAKVIARGMINASTSGRAQLFFDRFACCITLCFRRDIVTRAATVKGNSITSGEGAYSRRATSGTLEDFFVYFFGRFLT